MREKIRNFCIISHIDHGKSTLADRFLEITGTVPKEKMRAQFLDMMDLERERGITIKMQPVRMVYDLGNSDQKILKKFEAQSPNLQKNNLELTNSEFILNLIDTPGHVDFSYEVSRALAAVEGAILLVDATKGIQAQTIANLEMAKKENLVIIPAINKIDLLNAQIEKTEKEISLLLGVEKEEILKISAKNGTGVEDLILKIIEKIPPPRPKETDFLRALVFDSKYDYFQGVIAYVRIFDGKIKKGDKILFLKKNIVGEAKEVGYFLPELSSREELVAGEIGYIKTGIKNPEDVRIGDTITIVNQEKETERKSFQVSTSISKVQPLPGYKEPKPMIFSSIFPKEPTTFEELKEAIWQLHLSDPSFSFTPEKKGIIGIGFRCGFLGILHFEIVVERLKRDFNLDIFVARPMVFYRVHLKNGQIKEISTPEEFPEENLISFCEEPWMSLEIITPQKFFNNVLQLFLPFKINFLSSENFGEDKIKINGEMPFRKLIENFYDKLKSVSQGFASLNFEFTSFRKVEVVKMDILILKEKQPSLSKIVEKTELEKEARETVLKIKEVFPAQLFAVPIQAVVGGKVIARETIKAKRKDVTAPLYGGDFTRKKKLLEKQKKGKKELAKKAKIFVPSEVVIKLMKE